MAHVLSQKWLLNRRHFLKGLGVSMALPMLECMRPLRAAEAPAQPRRSVFIYLPNGVNTYDYQLEEEGPDYTLSTILAPLEPHRSFKFIKLQWVDCPCELWVKATCGALY